MVARLGTRLARTTVHSMGLINSPGKAKAAAAAGGGPTVSPVSTDVIRSAVANPTIAGVQYNLSGVEYSTQFSGNGAYNVSRGNWLDTGLNSEVWIERTLNVGTLTHADPGAGRKVLSTTRSYAVHDATIPGGSVDCTVTFDFWDAASGGSLLDSVTIDLSANRETDA